MQARSGADAAYEFTKERILDNRFGGGELLSEGEVAAELGMSRTPVREAFLRLQSDGLLRLYPKRGALVVPVSTLEVENVMETRLLVERFAVERVIALDLDLDEALEAVIARQEELAAEERSQEFVAADRELHRLVVEAAGNDILLGLHDSLRDRQQRMGVVALTRQENRMRAIVAEHREIASAIGARDATLALSLVDAHLHGTLTLLRARGRVTAPAA